MMGDVVNIHRKSPQADDQAPLSAGGGGDNSGGMEARVAKLESDVGHLLTDMKDVRDTLKDSGKTLVDLRERLTKVETKIEALPSKDFVVKIFLGGFSAMVAIMTGLALFQDRLQHLVGGGTH